MARRWLLVAGVAMVLAAVAGVWWLAHPTKPSKGWPALRSGERYGIDVSAHQGDIDWPKVAADDVSFAYVKATEGEDFLDRTFANNWAGVGRAGLPRGAYHFFSLCSAGEPQAKFFLDTAPPDPTALPPALDLELAGNCAARPERAVIQREIAAFLDKVEAAWSRKVVLYVGDDFDVMYPVRQPLARPLWYLRAEARPDVDWLIWQLHGNAHVAGITGEVDLDVLRDQGR
ncbi:hypothetical protein F0L68_13865 [Solihabitans fulvus]|uniref:Lysozyme n=1 Tax=Solihabitans fulvus TaxID=1892852 RepID=A0A5B2XHI6_9PSEU|nr:GH25 family lysozyme [Solihabitans fulvus]KAA2262351.1 hypothetical protein F0L68_13865 [Solihabitans fulvus]